MAWELNADRPVYTQILEIIRPESYPAFMLQEADCQVSESWLPKPV
ncbi:MAG: hypothetical protein V8S90_06935 [Lachnospiraceae bacterium]